jgi:hypothetical protein
MKTMLIEHVVGLIVVAHGVASPSDEDWDEYVELVRAGLSDRRSFRGVLATTLGGAPNAIQRKALQAVADSQPYRTCICTDSVIARGVIIAINWLFSTPMHALPYNDIDRALDLLDVPQGERSVTKATVARLHATLRESSPARRNASA